MREEKSDDNYEFRSVKKGIQLFIIVASEYIKELSVYD
jgi:hypothetical protein